MIDRESKTSSENQEIIELTEIMSQRLVDPTIVERYGTSLKMSMGREYNKYLNQKYHKLKEEFSKIDKNSDNRISFDELYSFFMNYEDKTGVKLTREYLQGLYEFMDQDHNKEITVQEFILSYMVIEEKLRHKQMHLKQIIDEYTLLREKYEKGIKENQNEELNAFGVSTQAEVQFTIIEAQELCGGDGSPNPYVVVTLDNQENVTLLKEDTTDPIFNEDLYFDMRSLESTAELKVIDKASNSILGVAHIKLKDYKNQVKVEKVLRLKPETPSDGNFGTIRIRIRVLWSKLKYFQDQMLVAEDKLEMANKESDEVARYLNLLDEPFGVIIFGEIENIMANEILEVPKDKEEILEKQRMSVLPHGRVSKVGTSFGDRFDSTLKKTFNINAQWSIISKVLLYCLIVFSLIQMIERPDFTGMIMALVIWYLFIQKSGLNIADHIMLLSKAMVGATVYDLLWLIFHYDGYFGDDAPDKTMKEFTYVIACFNFLVKIALIVSLNVNFSRQKRKQKQIQFETTRKSLNQSKLFSSAAVGRQSVGQIVKDMKEKKTNEVFGSTTNE